MQVYEIMWKNMLQPDWSHVVYNTRMRFACYITKFKNMHSEYVILIAYPQEQWLRERTSMLRYKKTGQCYIITPYSSQ
jgi:hypothetical protein